MNRLPAQTDGLSERRKQCLLRASANIQPDYLFAGASGKAGMFADGAEISKDMVQSVFREAVILLPLKGVIDFAAEKERLKKELEGPEQKP